MRLLFADTNIFLRFLLNDVPAQTDKAEEYLQEAQKGDVRLVVSQIVIFEVAFSLLKMHGFNKKKVVAGLETILSVPKLEIEERSTISSALNLYTFHNVDLVDCFLYVKAKNAGGGVLSFDKDFSRLEK